MRGIPVCHKEVRAPHMSDLAFAGGYGVEEREHVLLVHSRPPVDNRVG